MYMTTKSGRKVYVPTAEEDAIITAAALSDPDALPYTDAEWQAAKPLVRVGRPPSDRPLKVSTTIRLSPEVIQHFRASGAGWQSRIDAVLKDWVARQGSKAVAES
ncbi:BrnA antitoxin family protein [Amphibiibacter pelophylacis]|uniref:BrnA antitoxin family protein n=1 Tax=Amphibiibacter pelophylacis TaxID=1799477 RepID=A0ACC6P4T3_9BURK